jgi:alpha-L-rhamnosidase
LKTGEAAQRLMAKTLARESSMVGPTIYWHFYQFEALRKAGLQEQYLSNLGLWKRMIRAGVTTWPETGLESRSECHAWGASPNYHLYTLTAGIEPLAPGFAEVQIRPGIQNGESLKVSYPHPQGMIQLDLKAERGKLSGSISLPSQVPGTLIWQGQSLAIAGKQKIDLP